MQRNLRVDATVLSLAPRGIQAGMAIDFGKRATRSARKDKTTPAFRPAGSGLAAPLPLVAVIDDDQSVRESLPDLLRELGFAVQAFASAEDFLESDAVDRADCLLLDVAMPGMTGPELQGRLSSRRKVPIVFITAHADDAMRSRVVDAGAVDCLLKPFSESALLGALNAAFGKTS